MTVLWITLASLAFLVIMLCLIVLVGRKRFDSLVYREIRELFETCQNESLPPDPASLRDVPPAPVRRYLAWALGENPEPVQYVRLEHAGTFRTSKSRGFTPIQGQQYYCVQCPGFVWHARLKMAPGMWVEARDRLISGKANMRIKLWSTLKVGDVSGPELDQAALMRWLSEVPWFPQGFLHGSVKWTEIDEQSAKASVSHKGVQASGVFHFDQKDRIARFTTDRRYMEVNGKFVPEPWSALYRDYMEMNGVQIPTTGEAIWNLDSGDFSYARFRLTRIEYDVPARFG